MRKRSAYRPKAQLPDPVSWVLSGFKPMSSATSVLTTLKAKNHGAITAVMQGTATIHDAEALLGAVNMAEALARLGVGSDWLPEFAKAKEALRSAGQRPRFGFTGPELEIINTVMAVHDLQLDSPATTLATLDKALAAVKRDIRLKRTTRVHFPVAA